MSAPDNEPYVNAAVESVHRDDPSNATGPNAHHDPHLLDEAWAEWDAARLERCREHACLDCRQLEWLQVGLVIW